MTTKSYSLFEANWRKEADPLTDSTVVLITLILSQQTVGEVHKFNEIICDLPPLQTNRIILSNNVSVAQIFVS